MRSVSTTANKIAKQAMDLADYAGGEAYDAGNALSKQVMANYPAVSHKLRDALNSAYKQGRGFMTYAGHELCDAAGNIKLGARHMESSVLKFGAVYVFIKWLTAANDTGVAAGDRVKAHINEKPVESALIALGAGYLLGKLLR